nr:TPA_asm: m100.5 sORF 2 [Murid betaherpesvirus 1]DBA07872.1 TPA_asm: m100.5 sORF 2 [Murid betaherpesvirus 1]
MSCTGSRNSCGVRWWIALYIVRFMLSKSMMRG